MRLPRTYPTLFFVSLLCTLLLLTVTSCIDPAPITKRSTPQAQLLRRTQAQRLAAQAELELINHVDQWGNRLFDLPLLLAREAVLTTWISDGYVTAEADQALRAILRQAGSEFNLAPITLKFVPSDLFSATHDSVSILATALAPDGRTLAVATNEDGMGTENPLWLWNVPSRHLLGELEGLPAYGIPAALQFSPDSQTLLFASDTVATLWNWQTNQQLLAVPAPEGAFYYAGDFSPDGKMIVLAGKNVLQIVDTQTGALLHRLVAPNNEGGFNGWFGPLRNVEFDPSGKFLLTAGQDNRVYVWEVGQEHPVAQLGEPSLDAYPSAAFSPDGKFIALANHNATFQVWEVATQQVAHEFPVFHGGYASFGQVGNHLLVGSTLYDISTGVAIRHLTNNLGQEMYGYFAPDGETIVGVSGTTVEILPPIARMLAYADALIPREPPTFTESELQRFELAPEIDRTGPVSLDARPVSPYGMPPMLLTPRPRPASADLSPLPTPTPAR